MIAQTALLNTDVSTAKIVASLGFNRGSGR